MTGPTVSLQLLHLGNEILPISHNLPKRALCVCVHTIDEEKGPDKQSNPPLYLLPADLGL